MVITIVRGEDDSLGERWYIFCEYPAADEAPGGVDSVGPFSSYEDAEGFLVDDGLESSYWEEEEVY